MEDIKEWPRNAKIDYIIKSTYHSLSAIIWCQNSESNTRLELIDTLVNFQAFCKLIDPNTVIETPSDPFTPKLFISIVKTTFASFCHMSISPQSNTARIHYCTLTGSPLVIIVNPWWITINKYLIHSPKHRVQIPIKAGFQNQVTK